MPTEQISLKHMFSGDDKGNNSTFRISQQVRENVENVKNFIRNIDVVKSSIFQ